MDLPTELPLHGIHEELTKRKINWLPAAERKGDERRKEREKVKKRKENRKREEKDRVKQKTNKKNRREVTDKKQPHREWTEREEDGNLKMLKSNERADQSGNKSVAKL